VSRTFPISALAALEILILASIRIVRIPTMRMGCATASVVIGQSVSGC
jgi:hypothetical protein